MASRQPSLPSIPFFHDIQRDDDFSHSRPLPHRHLTLTHLLIHVRDTLAVPVVKSHLDFSRIHRSEQKNTKNGVVVRQQQPGRTTSILSLLGTISNQWYDLQK